MWLTQVTYANISACTTKVWLFNKYVMFNNYLVERKRLSLIAYVHCFVCGNLLNVSLLSLSLIYDWWWVKIIINTILYTILWRKHCISISNCFKIVLVGYRYLIFKILYLPLWRDTIWFKRKKKVVIIIKEKTNTVVKNHYRASRTSIKFWIMWSSWIWFKKLSQYLKIAVVIA